MKHTYSLLIVALLIATSCEPKFVMDGDLADDPSILSVGAGNEDGAFLQENVLYPEEYLDTVYIQDSVVDYSNIYIHVGLEKGCFIEPVEGSPPCGTYGNFSTPAKYRVTAPSGKTADWTIVLEYDLEP